MDIHISGCLLLQNNSGQQKSAEFYLLCSALLCSALLCSALLSAYCAGKYIVKFFFTAHTSFLPKHYRKRVDASAGVCKWLTRWVPIALRPRLVAGVAGVLPLIISCFQCQARGFCKIWLQLGIFLKMHIQKVNCYMKWYKKRKSLRQLIVLLCHKKRNMV